MIANKIKVFKKCPKMILFNGFKLFDANDVCRPDFWGWMFDFNFFIIKYVKHQEIWLWWHLTTRLLTPVLVFQTPIARALFCYWHFLKISIYLQKWLSIFNNFTQLAARLYNFLRDWFLVLGLKEDLVEYAIVYVKSEVILKVS